MSDPHDPAENPYGLAPFRGQQPLVPPAVSYAYARPAITQPRPGVVTGGAVLALVMSSIVVLVSLVMVVLAIALGDSVGSGLGGQDPGAVRIALLVSFGFFLVLSIAAVVCAALALRRSQGARIALLVLGFVGAALCLVSCLGNLSTTYGTPASAGFALLWLAGIITSMWLLLARSARDWYVTRPTVHSVVVPYPPMGPR